VGCHANSSKKSSRIPVTIGARNVDGVITNQSPRPRVRRFLAAARPEPSGARLLRSNYQMAITTDLAISFLFFPSRASRWLCWLIFSPWSPLAAKAQARTRRRGSRVHLVHRRAGHLRPCCCGYGATRARRAPSGGTRPPTPRLPSSPLTMSSSIFCRSSSVSGFCTEPAMAAGGGEHHR
jgi:hypothetical protein